jgi:hypothetical protein
MRTVVLALLLLGCSHPPEPRPEPDIVVVVPDAGGACDQACARLRELQCPEGNPSPLGTPCETVCLNAGALVDSVCVARATVREALPACRVRCRL